MKTIGVMHMLFVQDMDRAVHFFQQTFGLTVSQKTDFWSNLESGNGTIALCSFGNKTELKETTLIIEVDDYKEAVELVKQNKGTILKIGEPYEGVPIYNVEIIDTENNKLVISQKVKR
jgi:predicted enzyme related to lactoylglutathione lyase